MNLQDEIQRMTDYTRVYPPFMRLSHVGGFGHNARLLSYLLHLHMGLQADHVTLRDDAFRIVDMSPHDFEKSRQALVASTYVERRGVYYTVDLRQLLPDVQAVLDNQSSTDTTP